MLFALCTLGLALFLSAPAKAECTAKPGAVFFVTDREPLDDNQLFSGEWGTDANNKPVITTGVISAPVEKASEARCSSKQAFIKAIASQFVPKRPRQVLVFVHGYYTTFATAVETALALQKGLQFPGPLYVSNNDRALRQSEKYHGNQRAGQAGGDLILCNGVDTIDVSYLKSGGASGHGYLLDPRVLQDAAAGLPGCPPPRRNAD